MQDFFCQQGEIIASSNMLTLRGSNGMLPQEKFWNLRHLRLFLVASAWDHINFPNKNDLMIVVNFQGGHGHAVGRGESLVPHPLNKSLHNIVMLHNIILL